MTRAITVELDSYRLAQYATPTLCLICEEGNLPDAELCRRCFAPMMLAHQTRGVKPVMFTALGPSGVGKTVYLGMVLDMLSRQSQRLQLAARGGFSVTLQQNTLTALGRCEFPTKTPNEPDRWNWVHGELRSPKFRHPMDLVLPDIAGEALLEEVEHPRSYQVLHSLLSHSEGVFMLIDATKLQTGSLDDDYLTMKLLGHLGELSAATKSVSGRPMALIFSKADQCESCFGDPDGYARRHAPGVWRLCRQRFPKHRFFAAGVAGACATRVLADGSRQSIPLRVEPRGVIEPFEWLVENVRTH
jgi:hypothetical protein